MKHFLKIFFIAVLSFTLMIGSAFYSYVKFFNPSEDNFTQIEDPLWDQNIDNDSQDIGLTELEKAIKNSKRKNILILGLEEKRTDTIMLTSFDRKTGELDILSIPRDTYFFREDHDEAMEKKINSIYADSGVKGIMKAVENILGLPVHNYITLDYDGVINIIDTIGGVEVDVPFDMEYEDPYDSPPLVIDIEKGQQILDGEKALQYLRYRHNNDMTSGYKDGDIGRIKAQQEFVKSAVKKSIGFKLPIIAKELYNHIRTDLSLADTLLLTSDAVNFSTEKMNTSILPGRAKFMDNLSFYVHDPSEVKEYVKSLYNLE